MTDTDTLFPEIERELHHAIRRAWRQVATNWLTLEAELVLMAATALITQRRPDLDDAGVLAELMRLGVVLESGLVRVPPLPGEVLVPAGVRAN